MKTTSKKIASTAVAALCLALGNGLTAADSLYDPKPRPEYEVKSESPRLEGQPARFNKATGITGMEVRNQKDERLGHIKDVVFDLKTERVAYAVLATRGKGFMAREKLMAIPLNAFTASADHKFLVLRAEKSNMETAMGLDRDKWPSVTNPSYGAEPFWEKNKKLPAPEMKQGKLPEYPPEVRPETEPDPETPPDTIPDIPEPK